MGGTICHRGGALARCLQAQDHQRRGLSQCLEHRAATLLLPLINTLSLISFAIDSPIFSDIRPSNGKGSGLTRGQIREYLSGRHYLGPTFSHVKTQKRGLRKQTLNQTGRTVRNLCIGGYGIFGHQRDWSFFCTPGFFGLHFQKKSVHV